MKRTHWLFLSSDLILNRRILHEFLQRSTEVICLLSLVVFNLLRQLDDQIRFQKHLPTPMRRLNWRKDKEFYRPKEDSCCNNPGIKGQMPELR